MSQTHTIITNINMQKSNVIFLEHFLAEISIFTHNFFCVGKNLDMYQFRFLI